MAKGGGRGKRSYVRDARGRFASTPGGGAAKKAAKGRSVSTGRPQPRTFRQRQQASLDRRPGQGGYLGKATREAKAKLRASKAKLKASATPQQRAAVTRARIRAEGASPVTRMRRTAPTGVLKGVKVTRAQGRRAKPGQAQPVAPVKPQQQGSTFARMATIGRKRVRLTGRLINMNAREPYQFTPPPKNQNNPYQSGMANMTYRISPTNDDKKARLANAQVTKALFEQRGLAVRFGSSRTSNSVASYNPVTKEMTINRSHTNWVNPAFAAIRSRRAGIVSSSSPLHTFYHELGHARDKNLVNRVGPFGNPWVLATRQGSSQEKRAARSYEMQNLARRVSRYATRNPSEFIAETYAGLRTGRKYDREVMAAYREAMGLSAKPPARMRSRLPRRRKPAP